MWSNRAQEDSLLAMTSCDVSQKDRSRDVETYDHTIARKYYAQLNNEVDVDVAPTDDARVRINNKRSRNDRKDVKLRLMNRRQSRDSSEERVKGQPRILMEIVKEEKSNEEIAVEIANKLCENKEDLIRE